MKKNAPLETVNVKMLLQSIPIRQKRHIHGLEVERVDDDTFRLDYGPVVGMAQALKQIGSNEGKMKNPKPVRFDGIPHPDKDGSRMADVAHRAARPMTRIPKDYKYLLVDKDDSAWSGWEFKQDAQEELRDNKAAYPPSTRVLAVESYKLARKQRNPEKGFAWGERFPGVWYAVLSDSLYATVSRINSRRYSWAVVENDTRQAYGTAPTLRAAKDAAQTWVGERVTKKAETSSRASAKDRVRWLTVSDKAATGDYPVALLEYRDGKLYNEEYYDMISTARRDAEYFHGDTPQHMFSIVTEDEAESVVRDGYKITKMLGKQRNPGTSSKSPRPLTSTEEYEFLLVDEDGNAWSGWPTERDARAELQTYKASYPKGTNVQTFSQHLQGLFDRIPPWPLPTRNPPPKADERMVDALASTFAIDKASIRQGLRALPGTEIFYSPLAQEIQLAALYVREFGSGDEARLLEGLPAQKRKLFRLAALKFMAEEPKGRSGPDLTENPRNGRGLFYEVVDKTGKRRRYTTTKAEAESVCPKGWTVKHL